jgi:predicted RNase H-like nuclease
MGSLELTTLYGVDGAKHGWVVARATPDLGQISLYLVPELEPLFWRTIRDDGVLAIDIPIGLPDSGPRACDRSARRFLGFPKGTSVFPAPMRAALCAKEYPEACELNHAASGRKLSRQTFHLLPRLREVDGLMWVDRQQRIVEAHPEVSFATLASQKRGLVSRKKSVEGKRERFDILQRELPEVDLKAVLDTLPNAVAPLDDRLDALACLITASRFASGNYTRFPANQIEFDSRGLRMEIIA